MKYRDRVDWRQNQNFFPGNPGYFLQLRTRCEDMSNLLLAHSTRLCRIVCDPKIQRGSQNTPKQAKAKNMARHPQTLRTAEAKGNATIAPALPPLQLKTVAREYSWGGNQRTRILLMHGMTPLWPIPIKTLTIAIPTRDRGNGVRAVKSDHHATEKQS